MGTAETKAHWNHVYQKADYSTATTPQAEVVWRAAVSFFGELRGRRLLEIGCGPGASSLYFAQRGAEVVATDISENAIQHLRSEAEQLGVTRLHPLVCDAMDIGSLGRFDAVFGSMILHHIEPFPKFADTLAQVLDPKGKAFFWENNARSRLLIWCRKHLVGRFGIPKHGDTEEFPLTSDEIEELKARFRVTIEYPELLLFRLIPIYLFRGRAIPLFAAIDAAFYRRGLLVEYSYRQYLMLTA